MVSPSGYQVGGATPRPVTRQTGDMTGSVLPEHDQLLETLRPLSARFPLALAGADALAAHGVVVRPSRVLVLVAGESADLAEVATVIVHTLRTAGYDVRLDPGTPRRVGVSGGPRMIEFRKEPLRHASVVRGSSFPVVDLRDAAALAVLGLCDRALPTDLAVVHALTCCFAEEELVALAAALDDDFQAFTLAERLETAAAAWDSDESVPRWADAWAQNLRLDLLETQELSDGLHDPYLESPDVPADAADEL